MSMRSQNHQSNYVFLGCGHERHHINDICRSEFATILYLTCFLVIVRYFVYHGKQLLHGLAAWL
jgi:hypothetical protein